MKATIVLREKLGLTQEEMAQYLSITRGCLSMYESNKRDLPVEAIVKLAELELVINRLHKGKITSAHDEKQQYQKAQQLLQKDAEEQKHKQDLVQQKLTNVKKMYDKKVVLLKALPHLKAVNKNLRQTAWLDMIETQALDAIEKNGLHRQTMLELKLRTLNHQYQQALLLKEELIIK